jgi:hypothetical protein
MRRPTAAASPPSRVLSIFFFSGLTLLFLFRPSRKKCIIKIKETLMSLIF